MKTTHSIFKNIALGVLIAGSLAACKNDKTAAVSTTSSSFLADKEAIVYVNSDTLLSKYDYAKDIAKKISDKGKSAQDDIVSRRQAFQREVAEYQKAQATQSADQRQKTEDHLRGKQQEIQTYEQNASAEFQNNRDTENSKLFDKIADFVKGYAKEKGYKLVLTYSKANPTVLFGDPGLDVTTDVVKNLNEAYAKEKK